ncbi:MAG: hypothetical protein PUD50_12840, partial [Eubacteriales bacterium]|nr:hypothetical protein [Eubacteriales bacterium]
PCLFLFAQLIVHYLLGIWPFAIRAVRFAPTQGHKKAPELQSFRSLKAANCPYFDRTDDCRSVHTLSSVSEKCADASILRAARLLTHSLPGFNSSRRGNAPSNFTHIVVDTSASFELASGYIFP